MLTRIDLRHFKCFDLLKLPLAPLTLLSGANASGKSSVMHALVLLHQTMREHEWSTRLMLNGATVQLGTVADVIDQVYGRRGCEITLLDDKTQYEWEFAGEHTQMSMTVKRACINGDEEVEPNRLRHLLPVSHADDSSLAGRLCDLTYLTAERLGPRETYPLEDPQLTPVVGPKGEHAVSVLYSGRDTHVLKSLAVKDSLSTLFPQVEARMQQFFPGCKLELGQVARVNAVTLGIRTSRSTDFHRPIHTGFGLTQVLPIVVAALSSNRNGLLLIENPEVHLHPTGQAAMGRFLAEVTAAGIQVILETHSDHVLNGIRRAVRENILISDKVVLHFFRPRLEGGLYNVVQVQSPRLDANGNIDSWPEGFFDQFDKDMNYFAGWS